MQQQRKTAAYCDALCMYVDTHAAVSYNIIYYGGIVYCCTPVGGCAACDMIIVGTLYLHRWLCWVTFLSPLCFLSRHVDFVEKESLVVRTRDADWAESSMQLEQQQQSNHHVLASHIRVSRAPRQRYVR